MVQGLKQAAGGGAWSKLTRLGENKGSTNGRSAPAPKEPKKRVSSQVVWREARELIARYRRQLGDRSDIQLASGLSPSDIRLLKAAPPP